MQHTHTTRYPNFFIIGAPKCGTTSLASWLSKHPEIFMCRPKEPYFFCSDIRSLRAAETMEDYLNLFAGSQAKHCAVGEASTTYLRSHFAVSHILKEIPQARFIVCLRNPVDMVASVHAQLIRGGRETELDLATAWVLQENRRQGVAVPRVGLDQNDLQYGEMCRLGEQVERLLTQVPRKRVLFVFLEDIARVPHEIYTEVLSFLELPDDNREVFSAENIRAMPRSRLLNRALMAAAILKYKLGIRHSLGFGSMLTRLSTRKVKPEERDVSPAMRSEISAYFNKDIELLSQLVDRDLSSWQEQKIK